MVRKTISIAALLAITTFAQDGGAQAAARHREWHQGATRTGFSSLYRHHRFAAFGGHARRPLQHWAQKSMAAGTPRAAGLVSRATRSVQVGRASYYAGSRRTASGASVGAATCAHRSLPFGTKVLVTNLANARQAVLTVNDRGPFVRGRLLDVSRGAAGMFGMLHAGVSQIRMQVVGGAG